jgi:hypothetical protein
MYVFELKEDFSSQLLLLEFLMVIFMLPQHACMPCMCSAAINEALIVLAKIDRKNGMLFVALLFALFVLHIM